ncbi:MAG: hypothetical protein FWG70_10420 [Oscillospiraceae bacterium]|nr:hypothetical protein [Oscillospiraceae bacterium]
MKTKTIKAITLLIVLSVFIGLFAACNSNGGNENSLIGKWRITDAIIPFTREFKDDATWVEIIEFSSEPMRVDGTYTVDGDKLSLFITKIAGKIPPDETPLEFSYTFKGDELVLISLNDLVGSEQIYIRE